jgi:hypothetical protein
VPTLSRLLFNVNVEGRIADIQRLPEEVRIVRQGNGVPTPFKVRVSLSKRCTAGDRSRRRRPGVARRYDAVQRCCVVCCGTKAIASRAGAQGALNFARHRRR